MIKKIKFDSRQVRQALSLLVALLLVGSVSYLGEQFYRASHAATGASMSVNPSSGTFTPGSTVSLTIREDSGTDPVNSVQAAVAYSTSQLQYTGMTEGDFPLVAHNTTNPGEIIVSRYITTGPLSGNRAIVTLNFKVLASSGTVNVSIDRANSGVNRSTDDTDILQVLTGGSFTVGSTSANNATFSLVPATGSFAPNGTFNVDVHINSPSDRIVVAEPVIQYPTNKVTFVKATNSSAFSLVALDSNKNGVLDIMRGVPSGSPGLTGDNVVVTLQFKVTGTSGNIPLSFASASNAIDDTRSGNSVLNLAGSKGATYTISNSPTQPPSTTPPPTTAPTQGGGGNTGGGGGGSSGSGGGSGTPVSVVTNSGGLSVSTTGDSGSNVSQSGDATQLGGIVDLNPIIDPTVVDTDTPGGDSIAKVQYYLGKKLVDTEDASPFTYKFNTTKLKNGSYSITTKTYYQSGRVDENTDTLIVHNPVTLSYLIQHYAAVMLLTLLVVLVALFALWKYVLPHLRGGNSGYPDTGYNGYDGYVTPMTGGPMPTAPDPMVIAPNGAAGDGSGDSFTGSVAQAGPVSAPAPQTFAPSPPSPSGPNPAPAPGSGYVSPPTPPTISRTFSSNPPTPPTPPGPQAPITPR